MLTASKLTTGERLLLDRRRRELTKAQAAARLGVSLYLYGRWERDQDGEAPRKPIGAVFVHEAALILRRRAGLSVAELARRVGVSAYWLSLMERGQAPASRLEAYWRDVRAA